MHGNVWEWWLDWYDSEYYEKSPENNPRGPSNSSNRVARGGCWGTYAGGCRSAHRECFADDIRGYHLGFRVTLVSE